MYGIIIVCLAYSLFLKFGTGYLPRYLSQPQFYLVEDTCFRLSRCLLLPCFENQVNETWYASSLLGLVYLKKYSVKKLGAGYLPRYKSASLGDNCFSKP